MQHPWVQWVECAPRGMVALHGQWQPGFECSCTVCGASSGIVNGNGADQFAVHHREHRAVSGLGLGDKIAGVTKAFGAKPCTPCEQRRHKLNQMF